MTQSQSHCLWDNWCFSSRKWCQYIIPSGPSKLNFFSSVKITFCYSRVHGICLFAKFNRASLWYIVRDGFKAIFRQTRFGWFCKRRWTVLILHSNGISLTICRADIFLIDPCETLFFHHYQSLFRMFHIALLFHILQDFSNNCLHGSSSLLFLLQFPYYSIHGVIFSFWKLNYGSSKYNWVLSP